MTTIYGYARSAVATGSGTRPEIQEQVDRLKAAGCTAFFIDAGQSGMSRGAGLQQALDTLQAGDTFKVCDLGRLGRDMTAGDIWRELLARRVAVEILDGPTHSSNLAVEANPCARAPITT